MNRRDFLRSSLLVLASNRKTPNNSAAALDRWKNLKVGIICDEVTPDFETALKWIKGQNLGWVELRNLWGTYVTDLGDSDVRRAKQLLDKYGIRVSNIATAFLKATLPGTSPIPNEQMNQPFGIYPYEEHGRLLERAFEKARAFGVKKVRIFSFWRVSSPGEIFEKVKNHLVKAVGMAERAGLMLVLENEYACNVGTGTELAAMLKAIPSKNLAALWDPGNSFFAGEKPYPDGYRKLDIMRLRHMHLKDAEYDVNLQKRRWVPIGSGEIDIRGQIAALIRDRYAGIISVETHYVPENGAPTDGSLESLNGLRRIMKSLQ